MRTWTVHFTRKAYKQFCNLPRRIQGLVDLAVSDLEEQGINPQGWNIRKTARDEYRLRITYHYRMRFRVINNRKLEIEVFYLGHRREAYR